MRVFAVLSLLLAIIIQTTMSSGGDVHEEINKERRSNTKRYHRNIKNSAYGRIALEELTDNKNNNERTDEATVTLDHRQLRGGSRIRNRANTIMSELAEKASSVTKKATAAAEKAEERLKILAEKAERAAQRNNGNIAQQVQETVKKQVKRTRNRVKSPRSKLTGSTLDIKKAIATAQAAAKKVVDSVGGDQGGDESKRFRVDNDELANALVDKGLAKIYSGGRGQGDGSSAARARKYSKSEGGHYHDDNASGAIVGPVILVGLGALGLAALTAIATAGGVGLVLLVNEILKDDVPTRSPTRSPIGTPTIPLPPTLAPIRITLSPTAAPVASLTN